MAAQALWPPDAKPRAYADSTGAACACPRQSGRTRLRRFHRAAACACPGRSGRTRLRRFDRGGGLALAPDAAGEPGPTPIPPGRRTCAYPGRSGRAGTYAYSLEAAALRLARIKREKSRTCSHSDSSRSPTS